MSLTADLKTLQTNISTAQEFVENALGTSAEMLSSAPQLQVLKELAQKDAEMGQSRDHESRLNQIRVAMLQRASGVSNVDGNVVAGGIHESLNSALEELAKEQNASAASLKHAFDDKFQAGEEQRNRLLMDLRGLNAAETAALELNERLTVAVRHLNKTHETLLQKSQSMRQYAQRIGSRALPEQ